MKRLRHIDERLERWAAWLEGGAGSVAVATYARRTRVDCERPDHEAAVRDDAMHAETDRCVRSLSVPLRQVVLASYLSIGSIRGLAVALSIDVSALCSRIDAIERDHEEAQRKAKDSADSRKRQRASVPCNWLRTAVSVAMAVGITERAVHQRLCRADRDIARMLNERRHGPCRSRRAGEQPSRSESGFASVDDQCG